MSLGVIDKIYPVGSIYMSVNSTNPSTLFGGSWEQIQDRFLLAAGSSYSVGSTGGEASHLLTINEMPLHEHQIIQKGNTSYTFPSGFAETDSDKVLGYGSLTNITLTNGYYKSTKTWGGHMAARQAGGSQPHNNMPPYLTVYMWKRTA